MNRSPLTVPAAQFAADILVGVLMVWVPYLLVVGVCRGVHWLLTTDIPHGLFYLALGVLLLFLRLYLAARCALTHGPDVLSALASDARRLAASAWSRVGHPARLMLGGAVAVVALAAAVFTVCSAI